MIDVNTICSLLTFDRSGDSLCELQLSLNKSGELIKRLLSKLISEMDFFLPMSCLSDAFIQTTNMPRKPLDLCRVIRVNTANIVCKVSQVSISNS